MRGLIYEKMKLKNQQNDMLFKKKNNTRQLSCQVLFQIAIAIYQSTAS